MTVLSINQDTDNLIEVVDRNRKKILQELIESLLKEENRTNMLIPLTKKTSAEFPPLKFKYYSLQTKKRRKRLL